MPAVMRPKTSLPTSDIGVSFSNIWTSSNEYSTHCGRASIACSFDYMFMVKQAGIFDNLVLLRHNGVWIKMREQRKNLVRYVSWSVLDTQSMESHNPSNEWIDATVDQPYCDNVPDATHWSPVPTEIRPISRS